jgi:hypothetical protein
MKKLLHGMFDLTLAFLGYVLLSWLVVKLG